MVEDAAVLLNEGITEVRAGHYDAAIRLLDQARSLLDGKDDRPSKLVLSEALRWTAFAKARLGGFSEGVTLARKAMEISQSIGDGAGEADALRRLGHIHFRKGDYNLALEFFDTALKKATAAGATTEIGLIKLDQGATLSAMGRLKQSETSASEAIRILKDTDDMSELLRAYNNLGSCLSDQERYEEALEIFQIAKGIADNIGDEVRKGWSLLNIGSCLTDMGRSQEAIKPLKNALRLLEDHEDRAGIAFTHIEFGWAYTNTKELDLARRHLETALGMLERLELPAELGEVHEALAKVLTDTGDKPNVRAHLLKAKDSFAALSKDKDVARIEKLLKEQ